MGKYYNPILTPIAVYGFLVSAAATVIGILYLAIDIALTLLGVWNK